jgi:hypothetical protein
MAARKITGRRPAGRGAGTPAARRRGAAAREERTEDLDPAEMLERLKGALEAVERARSRLDRRR